MFLLFVFILAFYNFAGFYDLLKTEYTKTLSTCTYYTLYIMIWDNECTSHMYRSHVIIAHSGSFLHDRAHLPNPLSVETDLCWPQVMCERIINLSLAADWCV